MLGWSPAKISRYELGQGGFPLDEVGKLLDFYGVTEPRRTQLLNLAADANARGWWEDYADALTPEYVEFIGLEAEAYSESHFQVETVPGLLQTREYAWHIHNAVQSMVPTAPGVIERRAEVRMTRQLVLTERTPLLELAAIIDESALLRKASSLIDSSFVVFGFGSGQNSGPVLGDVVSTESMPSGELYVEGETDTYVYRLAFKALSAAALPSDESHRLIKGIAERVWG